MQKFGVEVGESFCGIANCHHNKNLALFFVIGKQSSHRMLLVMRWDCSCKWILMSVHALVVHTLKLSPYTVVEM